MSGPSRDALLHASVAADDVRGVVEDGVEGARCQIRWCVPLVGVHGAGWGLPLAPKDQKVPYDFKIYFLIRG